MANLNELRGKRALVTGAGDGIGEVLAKGLGGLGMEVAVQDIRADAAARVAGEIGGAAFPLAGDVSDPDQMLALAETLDRDGKALNLLWINAGVGVGSPLLGGKRNAIEWAFSVNALGVIWTAQAFLPLIEKANGPRVLGVTASSAALRDPEAPFSLYATTKHCTFAIAEALRNEVSSSGVETTILCPGLLNTDIWDGARARPDRFGGVRRMDPKISTRWREAKTPDVMWPHIERVLADGGGYLTCATEPGTNDAFEARAEAIARGIVEI